MTEIEGIAADSLAAAATLRAAGKSWAAVEREIGVSAHRLRRILDPSFAEKRNERVRAWRASHTNEQDTLHIGFRVAKETTLLRAVPADTRTWQARFLGDPLPGRSALDRLGTKQIGVASEKCHRDNRDRHSNEAVQ